MQQPSTPYRGTHDSVPDDRNERVLIYVNGELVPRNQATVSVFDSGFLLGDGVWEGLRLHHDTFVFLDEHLDRLFQGAKAIGLDIGMSRAEVAEALRQTVRANDMHDGVHVRLMVTRGVKKTPSQDPRLTKSGPTLVIIAEHKQANPNAWENGVRLFTSTIRRPPPDTLDQKLNCHSKLHEIIALNQAIQAGADEALMLDVHGAVSTCNATNFFIVVKGQVWTSTGQHCSERDHPPKDHRALPDQRHPRLRARLLAGGCLLRRRSVRHGHLRWTDTGHHRRWAHDRGRRRRRADPPAANAVRGADCKLGCFRVVEEKS